MSQYLSLVKWSNCLHTEGSMLGIPYSPTGQAAVQRSNRALKETPLQMEADGALAYVYTGIEHFFKTLWHEICYRCNLQSYKSSKFWSNLIKVSGRCSQNRRRIKKNLPGIKHWSLERTAELGRLIEVPSPEWQRGNMLSWGDFAFIPIGKEELCLPSKLLEIRVDGGDPWRSWLQTEGSTRPSRQIIYALIPLQGKTSETGWDTNKSCCLESSRLYLHAILSYDMDEKLILQFGYIFQTNLRRIFHLLKEKRIFCVHCTF